jgi:hypothetical protein
MPAMERTAPKPAASPRRKAPAASAGLPEDDRFAPHPGRSIDAVYVMAGGFELIFARPWQVLGVMLASLVLSGLLLFGLVTVGIVENALFAALGIDGPNHPAATMLLIVLGWTGALLMQTPLVGSAIEVYTRRRGLHAEFLRRGLARMGDLVASGFAVLCISAVVLMAGVVLQLVIVKLTAFVPWQVVTVMLRFAGFIAIVVTALRVITSLALVVPVIVVEQLPAADALRRAWALGWPNSFPMLMAFLLPLLVIQGVLLVFSYLPGFISIPVTIVLGTGLALYESVLVPVAYVAIREYVDGLDPERLVGRGARR